MNPKPSMGNILKNDNWAAPALAVMIVLMSMTTIVLVTNQIVGSLKTLDGSTFMWMTAVSCPCAIFISILRVRYVRKVFENGLKIQAQVLETSHFKSNLRMKLRYTYLSQIYEKKLEQVITGKTKKLLDQKQVYLVIDQINPNHILLWDAYM
jgi:hypothetical protein